MTTTTVVFDTNILFSGTGWRGSPFYCLKLVRDGRINLVICREILKNIMGKADHIVSGDHHLLDLKEYKGIRIFRANDFLDFMNVVNR